MLPLSVLQTEDYTNLPLVYFCDLSYLQKSELTRVAREVEIMLILIMFVHHPHLCYIIASA